MNREEALIELETEFGECDCGNISRMGVEDFIDKIYDQHEAELNELKNRTCEGCKYLITPIDIPICDIHNYYLTADSIKVLNCNKWEKK